MCRPNKPRPVALATFRFCSAALASLVLMLPLAAAADESPFQEQKPDNSGPGASADDDGNLFAAAIDYAQARCVKIYGASIGREPGYATGILVSADGLILTAQGIYLSGDRIRVVLPDGSLHLAEVAGRSEALQAALLKINAPTPDYFEVPPAPPAAKGDWVVAISNLYKVADGPEPLSANLGILSLRTRIDARRGTQDVRYDGEVLLIDAITSNPGAPGGAVVNDDGQLVGMIGKIIESTSTGTRLNYAVPSDLLRMFLDGKPLAALAAASGTGKASLGIQLFTLGGKRAPAYIDRVLPGSAAEKAGLQKDDLILAVGGEAVRNVQDYQKTAGTIKPGEEIVILVKRKREVLTVRLTPVAEQPSSEPSDEAK